MKQVTSNTIDLTPLETREMHCVYSHSLPPYTDIFYIGVSRLRDVHDFTEAYKNSYWRAVIKEDTPIRITILGISMNVVECNQHFRALYDQLRPIANVQGFVQFGKSLVTCIAGPNVNVTYSSQLEAARYNGITPGTMSNHLNGRPGYENIRGMKFVRGGVS